jgi:hypothetical protein
LEELDLYGVKITDAGVGHLSGLTALRRFSLLGAQITDASAEILARMKELRELNIYRSRITNAGLAKLAALPELRVLDVRYTDITGAGVETFSKALPACRVVFVNNSAPSGRPAGKEKPAGTSTREVTSWIESLGGTTRVTGGFITSISLARVPFTDAQAAHLASIQTVERLDLEAASEVGDLSLAAIGRMTSLRDLNLGFTSVSDRGPRETCAVGETAAAESRRVAG